MNMAQRFLGHKPQCSASKTLCGFFEKLKVENIHEAVIGTQLPGNLQQRRWLNCQSAKSDLFLSFFCVKILACKILV